MTEKNQKNGQKYASIRVKPPTFDRINKLRIVESESNDSVISRALDFLEQNQAPFLDTLRTQKVGTMNREKRLVQ